MAASLGKPRSLGPQFGCWGNRHVLFSHTWGQGGAVGGGGLGVEWGVRAVMVRTSAFLPVTSATVPAPVSAGAWIFGL